jgi:hypothetical protein
MNRWRVGEDMGSKETDGCPLTVLDLDLERAMGKSVAEGPAMMQATTQDEEVGESEWDESVEEEPESAAVAVESSTIGKGKS